METPERNNLIATSIILIIFFTVGYIFTATDNLAGFSDDSATYMIMADNLSPFSETSDSFMRSYHYHHLPPGFPLIQAIFNIHNSLYATHILILIELTVAVIFFIQLSKTALGRDFYLLPAITLLLLPGLWMEMLRIISEHQYMMLSLITLYFVTRNTDRSYTFITLIGLLIGFAILTRTIGISLLIATLLYLVFSEDNKHFSYSKLLLLILLSCAPFITWGILKPEIEHSYFSDLIRALINDGIINTVKNSLVNIPHAWVQNIALRPSAIYAPQYFIALISGLIVILGMISRIRSPDTIYTILYMGILMIWPYPDEMSRFLYPLLPFLTLHFISGLRLTTNALRRHMIAIFLLFIITVPAPALFAVYDRYKVGSDLLGIDVSHIPELYTTTSSKKAYSTAIIWNGTIELMKSLKPVSSHYGKALTIKPQFLTYLSNVYSEKIPLYIPDHKEEYYRYIMDSGASHIILTTIPVSIPADNINMTEILSNISDIGFKLNINTNTDKITVLTMMNIRRQVSPPRQTG